MALYRIPEYKIEDLKKKINHIRNKGANVTFNITQENINVSIPNLRDRYIVCSEIDVEGYYIINGWHFVATIEHSQPENIIRLIDHSLENQIPERYRTADTECEHCHIRRSRNDTYLVYNDSLHEWKQVGRTCLKSYTNGLDAAVCAELVNVERTLSLISNNMNSGEFPLNDDDFVLHIASKLEGAVVRKKVLQYVIDNGYTSQVTATTLKNILFALNRDNLPQASNEDVRKIDNIISTLTVSDWSRNAIAVWNKEYIEPRDLALLASFCSVALKQVAKEEARRNLQQSDTNTYAGEVGQVLEITIQNCQVAYMREPNVYNASAYPVYRITDITGKLLYWGCSNPEIEPKQGDILKGKVKSNYENRRGEKITELTRCKITGHTDTPTRHRFTYENYTPEKHKFIYE